MPDKNKTNRSPAARFFECLSLFYHKNTPEVLLSVQLPGRASNGNLPLFACYEFCFLQA